MLFCLEQSLRNVACSFQLLLPVFSLKCRTNSLAQVPGTQLWLLLLNSKAAGGLATNQHACRHVERRNACFNAMLNSARAACPLLEHVLMHLSSVSVLSDCF